MPAPAIIDVRIDAKVSVEALVLSYSSVNSELNTPSTNVPVALPTSLAVVMNELLGVAASASSSIEAAVSSKGRLVLTKGLLTVL